MNVKVYEGSLSMCINTWRGGGKGDWTRLFSGAQWNSRRQWALNKMQETPFKCKEKLFHCASSQTLDQVIQRDGGVSVCGDGQNPTRHGLEQPAVGDPALSWEVGLMISGGAFWPLWLVEVTSRVMSSCQHKCFKSWHFGSLVYFSQNMESLQKEIVSSNHENIHDCETPSAFVMERKNVLLAREIVNYNA